MRRFFRSLFHCSRTHSPKLSDSVLISFCNLDTTVPDRTGLLQLDLKTEKGRWIEINGNGKKVSSCTGISHHNSQIYQVFRSGGAFHLAVLDDHDLELHAVHQLTEVEDVHSIFVNEVGVYAVSTGTDEIVLFPLQNGKLGKKEVVWSPSGQGIDTHHLNSVWVEENGHLICSGFGPKKSERWSSADEGYVYNITTDTIIEKPILHPHSVTVAFDNLYYCESSFSSVNVRDRGRIFQFQGYTRGICFLDDTTVVVGSSLGRKVSKSTGLINNIADPGIKAGQCEIRVCDLKTKQIVKRIDLSEYGDEIYDLHYLPGNPVREGMLPARKLAKVLMDSQWEVVE